VTFSHEGSAHGGSGYNYGVLESAGLAAIERQHEGGRSGTLSFVTILLMIALTVMGVLYVTRMIALFPLEHDVEAANSTGDDWFVYHVNALSVLNDGLTMPVVDGVYRRPAGFGYVYFIAAVYAIAGVKSEAVYLVQGLLLIVTIAAMYAVVRSRFSALGGLVFVLTLTVFLYVDAYRALTFRLLSENALFPLLPALLFFIIKGEATTKLRYLAVGGAVCGLCFLARPNLVLLGPAAAAVVLYFKSSRPLAWRTRAAATVLAAFTVVASLLPLRNYFVTGQPSVASVTNRSDWSGQNLFRESKGPLSQRVGRHIARLGARAAYLVGIPQFLRPAFRIRPHWLVMWGAFGWYLYTVVRRTPQFWEVLVLALAVSYFAPIVEYGAIASYGIRMIAPGVLLILVLAAKGLDEASLKGARE
jgi:4-amino-4-deoxy-L-arabinose transferase-like glycosyltransferase